MIEYLKVEGKEIPVRINRRAIIQFEKQTKTGLKDLGSMGTEMLSKLLFIAVCEGYKFLGQENPYKSYGSFEDVLDSMTPNDFYDQAGTVISAFFSQGK